MRVASPTSFECVRCGALYPTQRDLFGCPRCAPEVPANLRLVSCSAGLSPALVQQWQRRRPGVWRFVEALPVAPDEAVSLGEGGTPLLDLPHLALAVGLPRLLAKNEGQNPTWSFKDRLASVAVSWARATGRRGIAVSSSGNAGASAAAYAARAGLPCIIFTTRGFPGTMQRFMRAYGAMVVAVPEAADRWTLNRAVAEQWGWLPLSNVADPPVGSHPAGVEGHKTIAYELALDLEWDAPDAVIVPVAYGDALAGLHRGFDELHAAGIIKRRPRLIAVEAYPSLTSALVTASAGPVLADGSGSQAFSVATRRSTYQALQAVRATGGTAVVVPDEETRRWHTALREREGLFVEFSSAMPVAAAARLCRDGLLAPTDRVVVLLTSGGLKDPEITLPDQQLPLVEPNLAALERLLAEHYGYAP
jgi:threonine synthase